GPGAAVLDRLRLDPTALALLGGFEGVRVFENREAVPRAHGVYRAEVIAADEAQLERLLAPDFDARHAVILERAPRGWRPPEPAPTKPPEVAWLEERPGGARVRLRVRFPADGLLVLTDNHFPGWTAAVDGRAAELLRANYAFRAVAVPAGEHEVTFRYWPPSLTWGLLLAGLGLVALTAFVVATRRR
ncbi:MAG: YfhO family protein, partial [Planctomycetes bacterium]|nr:YfhO family protein [Planctomycetota bacterium]